MAWRLLLKFARTWPFMCFSSRSLMVFTISDELLAWFVPFVFKRSVSAPATDFRCASVDATGFAKLAMLAGVAPSATKRRATVANTWEICIVAVNVGEPKVQLVCQSPRFGERADLEPQNATFEETRARLDSIWQQSVLACELRNHKPYHLLANPTVIASYIVQNDNFASELLLSSFGSNWHVSFIRFLPSVMMSCWNNFWMSHKNHVRLTGLGGIESSSRMLLFLVHDLRNSWGSWPFFICQTTMWKMTGEWDTLYHHMLISHWHFATEVKNNKPPATKTSVQPFYMFNLSVVCLLGRHCANLPAKL